MKRTRPSLRTAEVACWVVIKPAAWNQGDGGCVEIGRTVGSLTPGTVGVGDAVGLVCSAASPLTLALACPDAGVPECVPRSPIDATTTTTTSAPTEANASCWRPRRAGLRRVMLKASVRAATSALLTRSRKLASSLGSAGQSFISKVLPQTGQARLQLSLDRVVTDAQPRRRPVDRVALQVVEGYGGAHASWQRLETLAQRQGLVLGRFDGGDVVQMRCE